MELFTYHALGVTILPGHRQVQPKEIAVDHIDVAGLRTAEGINPPVERFVRAHLNGNPRVLAIDRHCNHILRLRLLWAGQIFIYRSGVDNRYGTKELR